MSNANAAYIYQQLTAAGLSSGAATGVIGNVMAESGADPAIHQIGGGPGRGIAQWSVGGRWDTLTAAAARAGASATSLAFQTQFMISEMKGMGVWSSLLKTNDPNAAAAIVMRQYEMPADQSAAAAAYRARLGISTVGSMGAPTGNPGSAGAGAGTGGGGGGTPASGTTQAGGTSWAGSCAWGFSLPVVGQTCILTNGQLAVIKGGLLMGAGGVLGIAGLFVLAAYGFKASGALRATGSATQAVGAGVSLFAPQVGAPIAAAGSAARRAGGGGELPVRRKAAA